MTFPSSRRTLLLGVSAMIFVGGAASAGLFGRPLPDLDLSLSKATEAGRYIAAIAPVHEPVTVGRMHAWTVTLATKAGVPVSAATIGIDGGMPRHGHGLPTAPAVTSTRAAAAFSSRA
jgi:hypothetical protein